VSAFQQVNKVMAAIDNPSVARSEKRRHRRLELHLPLEFSPIGQEQGRRTPTRTTCLNISPGGVYFETLSKEDLRPGILLELELTIPPGERHFPYQGRVTTVCQVIRATAIDVDGRTDADADARGKGRVDGQEADHGRLMGGYRRVGIAAQFKDSLRLSF
jgi:hypothetical protein